MYLPKGHFKRGGGDISHSHVEHNAFGEENHILQAPGGFIGGLVCNGFASVCFGFVIMVVPLCCIVNC